jgi:proteasome assembly chaperone 4
MSSEELRASFSDLVVGSPTQTEGKTYPSGDLLSEEGIQVTCFTEDLHDVVLHFQIVRFSKQVDMVFWLQLEYRAESVQIPDIA